jgi:uncharacterized protein YdaU (DUF1376 family)
MPLVRQVRRCRAFEAAAVKGFPYTPWYHGDFLRSTAGWTLLERAVYWMLLCAQWETGQLPNDLARLASIAGMSQTEMSPVWSVVSIKFKQTKNGLRNARMDAHRRNYHAYRLRQVEGGRKGAATRWKKTTNIVPFRTPEGSRE